MAGGKRAGRPLVTLLVDGVGSVPVAGAGGGAAGGAGQLFGEQDVVDAVGLGFGF